MGSCNPRLRLAVRLTRCLGSALLVLVLAGCGTKGGRSGEVVAVFGHLGMGPGDFSYPRAIAADPDGSVLVVDKTGRVQRFSEHGAFIGGWRMPLTETGKPVGLAVHPDRRVFVADTHYSRVAIFSPDGELLATFGEEGDGPGQFRLPTDVAFDAAGRIFVSEYGGNDRVTHWSPTLEFVGVVIAGEVEGLPLSRPAAIEVDREQALWVADACNHRLLHVTREGTVLRSVGRFGRGRGEMRYPYDVAMDREGKVLACEYGGDRLQWFDPAGEPLGIWGGSGRAAGKLHAPWGAAIGSNGWVYVVDSLNSRVQIFRP